MRKVNRYSYKKLTVKELVLSVSYKMAREILTVSRNRLHPCIETLAELKYHLKSYPSHA